MNSQHGEYYNLFILRQRVGAKHSAMMFFDMQRYCPNASPLQ